MQGEPEDLEEVDDEALPRTLFAPGQPGDKAARPRGPHEPNMHKHHAVRRLLPLVLGLAGGVHCVAAPDWLRRLRCRAPLSQRQGATDSGRCVQHMASCADMLTFATLLFGCVVVWGCLLRTFIRCRRMVRKVRPWALPQGPACRWAAAGFPAVWEPAAGCRGSTAAERPVPQNEAALLKAGKRAAVVEHNPLLTPLVREESIDVPQVAVASYEVPSGSYYVPQGSQYVQVAYQPLRSE